MSGHHEDIIFISPEEWIFRWEAELLVEVHRIVHFGTKEWYDLDDARIEQMKRHWYDTHQSSMPV